MHCGETRYVPKKMRATGGACIDHNMGRKGKGEKKGEKKGEGGRWEEIGE